MRMCMCMCVCVNVCVCRCVDVDVGVCVCVCSFVCACKLFSWCPGPPFEILLGAGSLAAYVRQRQLQTTFCLWCLRSLDVVDDALTDTAQRQCVACRLTCVHFLRQDVPTRPLLFTAAKNKHSPCPIQQV